MHTTIDEKRDQTAAICQLFRSSTDQNRRGACMADEGYRGAATQSVLALTKARMPSKPSSRP